MAAWTDTFVDSAETVQKYSSITFDATSPVTTTELIDFGVTIAQQLVADMAILGHTRVPADTPTEPEVTLLRETNAVGTAWLAVMASFYANRSPNRTSHADDLAKMYLRHKKQLLSYLKEKVLELKSTDHLIVGDVTRRTVTTVPEQSGVFSFDDDL